jgi:hypothetical protein
MSVYDSLRYSGFMHVSDEDFASSVPPEDQESTKTLSETLEDLINKPKHYNQGRYQPIHVIEDWKLDYHLGNVLKYISRARHKGSEIQDLEKAAWYLQRYIEIKKGE